MLTYITDKELSQNKETPHNLVDMRMYEKSSIGFQAGISRRVAIIVPAGHEPQALCYIL